MRHRLLEAALALGTLTVITLTGCQDILFGATDSEFASLQTRPSRTYRREGSIDDRNSPYPSSMAASAWMTLVRRRNPVTYLSSVEVLVVAGGGGGGAGWEGGGGGAGGLVYNASYGVTHGTPVSVTVGAGGVGGSVSTWPTDGGNSVFGSITAMGGGRGAGEQNIIGPMGGSGGRYDADNGGSGGGGSHGDVSSPNGQGSGTAGQGHAGAPGWSTTGCYAGGGGGGAGAAGSAATSTTGGAGGIGLAYGISGSSTYYAGGGGGSYRGAGSTAGGNGGGGNGNGSGPGGNGTPGTGGGGGAAGNCCSGSGVPGGAGGSGIVIVRYPGMPQATGGSITSSGGYTIHTFTGSGTFTP